MKYVPPVGATETNASYIDENLAAGIEGSPVPAAAIEHPQREIMHVITEAGLTPSAESLRQLYDAIVQIIGVKAPNATLDRYGLVKPDGVTTYITTEGGLLAASPDMPWRPLENYRAPCMRLGNDGKVYLWKKASGPAVAGVGAKDPTAAGGDVYWLDYVASIVPEKYDIAQYSWFEDDMPRPGLFSCLGGVVSNFAAKYPKAAAYFETSYGQKRLVTQAEYDALHVYSWYTDASGNKVGWNGIGGVNKFVWDKAADTLRLPDLAGMTPEQVGYIDSLGVGGVRGDQVRNITGETSVRGHTSFQNDSGALYATTIGDFAQVTPGGDSYMRRLFLNISRQVPAGPRNHGPRYISDARIYLGQPVL